MITLQTVNKRNRVPFYYNTYANCKVTLSIPNLLTFISCKKVRSCKKSQRHSSIEWERGLKSNVLLDIIEGFYILCVSLSFVYVL